MPIKIHEEENFLRIPFHSSLQNFDSIFDSDARIANALALSACEISSAVKHIFSFCAT